MLSRSCVFCEIRRVSRVGGNESEKTDRFQLIEHSEHYANSKINLSPCPRKSYVRFCAHVNAKICEGVLCKYRSKELS